MDDAKRETCWSPNMLFGNFMQDWAFEIIGHTKAKVQGWKELI